MLMFKDKGLDNPEDRIEENIKDILRTVKEIKPKVAIISNNTGAGIVPDNPLARFFRDMSGFSNQMVAREANEVYKMEVGIPIRFK